MYYNTVNETGQTLKAYKEKARTQDEVILEYFKEHPKMEYTPFDIQMFVLPNAPITSVRRSITNLTEEGLLIKTATLRTGKYGRKCHCWRYYTKELLLF